MLRNGETTFPRVGNYSKPRVVRESALGGRRETPAINCLRADRVTEEGGLVGDSSNFLIDKCINAGAPHF